MSLKQITFEIPSSLDSILSGAFCGCSSLTQISIPSSVNSIGSYSFKQCSSLTQISIPSSVASIGNYAFSGCPKLDKITILPNKEKRIEYFEDKFLIYKTNENSEVYDSLLWVKPTTMNTITIPPFIKKICT